MHCLYDASGTDIKPVSQDLAGGGGGHDHREEGSAHVLSSASSSSSAVAAAAFSAPAVLPDLPYDVGALEDVRLELAFNFDKFEPADLGACGPRGPRRRSPRK